MFLNSVMMSWLFILGVSSVIGLLIASLIGSRLPLGVLIALSVFNLAGISALMLMLLMPMHSEGQVYAVAEINAVLIIVLLCMLPSTVFFWFVRLKKRRELA